MLSLVQVFQRMSDHLCFSDDIYTYICWWHALLYLVDHKYLDLLLHISIVVSISCQICKIVFIFIASREEN